MTATIFQNYDDNKQAFINPADVTKADPHFPELCVTTFSESIIQKFSKMDDVKQIASLYSANGTLPVYKINYKNHRIAFFLSRVGAPACVAGLEEIIALGAKKIVLFGCCGILNDSAVQNKVVVPASAFRDEGTSYHYLPASEEICMDEKSIQILSTCLNGMQIPYVLGKTWTTDAIYRETPGRIAERKQQGCIVVEMECSAALAVTHFREIPFAQFLYGADSLDSENWEIRNLMDYGLAGSENYMALAFECAISL